MWLFWLALTAAMDLIPELAFVIVPFILLYLGIRYWAISLPLLVVAFVALMWEPRNLIGHWDRPQPVNADHRRHEDGRGHAALGLHAKMGAEGGSVCPILCVRPRLRLCLVLLRGLSDCLVDHGRRNVQSARQVSSNIRRNSAGTQRAAQDAMPFRPIQVSQPPH